MGEPIIFGKDEAYVKNESGQWVLYSTKTGKALKKPAPADKIKMLEAISAQAATSSSATSGGEILSSASLNGAGPGATIPPIHEEEKHPRHKREDKRTKVEESIDKDIRNLNKNISKLTESIENLIKKYSENSNKQQSDQAHEEHKIKSENDQVTAAHSPVTTIPQNMKMGVKDAIVGTKDRFGRTTSPSTMRDFVTKAFPIMGNIYYAAKDKKENNVAQKLEYYDNKLKNDKELYPDITAQTHPDDAKRADALNARSADIDDKLKTKRGEIIENAKTGKRNHYDIEQFKEKKPAKFVSANIRAPEVNPDSVKSSAKTSSSAPTTAYTSLSDKNFKFLNPFAKAEGPATKYSATPNSGMVTPASKPNTILPNIAPAKADAPATKVSDDSELSEFKKSLSKVTEELGSLSQETEQFEKQLENLLETMKSADGGGESPQQDSPRSKSAGLDIPDMKITKSAGKAAGVATRIGPKLLAGGKILAGGGAAVLGGMALNYGGDKLAESGHTKLGAGTKIAGDALSGAGTGAMIGSIIPGVGTAVGAGVGGAIGAGVGLWKNRSAFLEKPVVANQTLNLDEANKMNIVAKEQKMTPVHAPPITTISSPTMNSSSVVNNVISGPTVGARGSLDLAAFA
jgi:prefoldin subunit 5